MKRKAFTLIELLVVIAIIALLLSVVMPGLNMAKKKAASAACLSNAKQLSVAWYMYTEDNDGRLCSSSPSNVEHRTKKYGWVYRPIDAAGNSMSAIELNPSGPVTDEDEIRGIRAGVLFDYYEAPNVMHCPADKIRTSKIPGDGTKIFRSYSMPSYLNGVGNDNAHKMVRRLTNVTATGSRIMLVEEADSRNYNNGAWDFGAPGWTGKSVNGSRMTVPQGEIWWWDPVAVNHGDASILGFCDGHAEVHKWRVPSTKERMLRYIESDRTSYGLEQPTGGTADVEFVNRAWGDR